VQARIPPELACSEDETWHSAIRHAALKEKKAGSAD